MRNRGAILLLAILLALVCLYHLSFTFVSMKVERDAKKQANGDINKEKEYLKTKSTESVWLWRYTYKDCKEQEINLGLDLKGGMNVILEISVIDVIKSLAGNKDSPILLQVIAKAKEKQKTSNRDFVTLFGEAFDELQPGGKLEALFRNPDMKTIDYSMSNSEVLKIIRKETKDAIDNSFNVLSKRIDKFGVTQPNIQRLETAGRILIELPGIKDQERVRKLLQGTASLEFWLTYKNNEIYQNLLDANKRIAEMLKVYGEVSDDTTKIRDTVQAASDTTLADSLKADLAVKKDTAKAVISPDSAKEPSLLAKLKDTAKSPALLDKLGKKDTAGSDTAKSAVDMEKEYPLFALLKPNITQDGKLNIEEAATIGFAHADDTGKVNDYLSHPRIKALFPNKLKFCWSVKPLKHAPEYYELIALQSSRGGKPALSGDVIVDARDEISQSSANAEVSMQMDAEGSKVWKRLTGENIGRQVAVVLDGYVYSDPKVRSEIPNGSSRITGNFTIEEAKDLANVLKSGKMPAPASIISEEIVGPTLGKESIRAGMFSFLIAFIMVLIYMAFYYNKAGFIADIALFTNVFFIMGVLASLGAVLTLPGIAGIVLTMGMAVDANVLIYERIREELRAGKGLKLAISDGYKNASSAIIDSNVTTLLTGVVLYIFGTGPIQGFATTLIIGILTSLFSAIFISRLIFTALLGKNIDIKFSIRLTANIFRDAKYKFLENRKIMYICSSIVIGIGLISLIFRGLDPGVDFTGGRSYVVRFDNDVKTADVKKYLKASFGGLSPEVKTFGADNQVKITTKYLINSDVDTVDKVIETKLYEGLKPILGENVDEQKFNDNYRLHSYKVEPTIVTEMIWAAFMAVGFALIIIFLYIFMRFKNWRFGLGAFVSLFHDVLFVIGMYSLLYSIMPFSMEIDQTFIAAILTVIGYSINDTVVVYDRLREFLGLYKKRPILENMNAAMNSTLGRTINTSLTTLLVLFVIFIFGGEVIRGFIFAMLIGIFVGTYSSIFVASSIFYDTVKNREDTSLILKGKKKI
ncbi:MAG: protein translocase subunit SecDF [Bacteroidia bacterium]|nr:protein translocase subunit SecDF [Bacteroidia bacterium]